MFRWTEGKGIKNGYPKNVPLGLGVFWAKYFGFGETKQ